MVVPGARATGAAKGPRERSERGNVVIRVRIVDPQHPHYPEHGVLTGEVISLLGTPMVKMTLDACQHGTDACFVSKGQIAEEKPWR